MLIELYKIKLYLQSLLVNYKILDTKQKFIDDLVLEIRGAKNKIVFLAYIWGNDIYGKKIARELLEAADRGVKVLIIKDRSASVFEYFQVGSFFHGQSRLGKYKTPGVYYLRFINLISKIYFSFVSRNKPKESQELAESFFEHKNVEVEDSLLYNHSKVVQIDNRVSYIGGMAIAGDENEKTLDYMVKIEGEGTSEGLYDSIVGEKKNCKKGDYTFVTDYQMIKMGSSIHDFALRYIRETKEKLIIEMAYFGNRHYIEELSRLVNNGKRVTIIAPSKSDVNFDVNVRVLKKLKKQIRSNLLKIVMYNGEIHAKLFIRDDESVFVGSHNMSMSKAGTIGEANVLIQNQTIVREFLDSVDYFLRNGNEKTLEIARVKYSRLLFGVQRFAIIIFTLSFYLRRKTIKFNKETAISKYSFFYS